MDHCGGEKVAHRGDEKELVRLPERHDRSCGVPALLAAELGAYTKHRRTYEEEHFPDSHHPHWQSAPS